MKPICCKLIVLLLLIQNIIQAQDSLIIDYGNCPDAGKFVNVNNARIYYESYGDKDPLILLHGNHGSIAYMHQQIRFFSNYYRVVALDSRNHGKSSKKNTVLSYELMAKDVIALMDSLMIPKAHFIGWSDGANIGLQIAKLAPNKIGKLIMMAGNYKSDTSAVAQSIIDDIYEKARSAKNNIEKSLFQLMLDCPKLSSKDLQTIKSKILILSADNDIIKPPHSQEMHNLLSNSELFIVPNSTHMLPIENPGLFNFLCLNYLKSEGDYLTFSGRICNKEDKGLEYINMGIRGENIGTTSLKNGAFELKIPKYKYINDSIFISSLGYESYSIPITEIQPGKSYPIRLKEKDYQIEQVNVKAGKVKRKVFGIKRAGNGIIKGSMRGTENAFLVKVKNQTFKVKEIRFGTWFSSQIINFRVKFYDNSDSVPGNSLLNKNLVYSIKSDEKGWVSCNLSELDIFIDQDFFTAIELLPQLDTNGEKRRPQFMAKMIAAGSVFTRNYFGKWERIPINSAINIAVEIYK